MKIKKILVFASFLVYFNCMSQNKGEVTYKVKLIKNNTSKKVSNRSSKILNFVLKEVNSINISLFFNDGKSIFKENEVIGLDDKRQMARNMAKAMTDLRSIYYCNLKEKTILREREFDGKYYNILSKFSDLSWKLINETKVINDYKCYKAITTKVFKTRKGNIVNQEVIAWYAPKIPIPLGPKNYVGLPGLILELNEGKNKKYYVTQINLNLKKININKPKKGIIITEKEYAKITEGSTQRLINSMKN